jgi:ATP-dependent protease ClpP protease subunit
MQITVARSGSVAHVRITGVIGWESSADDFRSQVESLEAEGVGAIRLYINSPGGSVFDAAEIVNILSTFKGEITGEGGAIVASAATYIAVHCKSFSMPANGMFMIHRPSTGIYGKAKDLRSALDHLQLVEDDYRRVYLKKTTGAKLFEAKWDDDADWWMTAAEAKANGFVSEVRPAVRIDRASACMIAACGRPAPETIEPTDNQANMEKELKEIAAALGLAESATATEATARIAELKKAETALAAREQEIAAVRAREIAALVDGAIRERRITADKKDHFVKVGASIGAAELKTTLEAMSPVVKPMDIIRRQNPDGSAKTFAEMTGDERMELRESNPSEYAALYRSEYGVDFKH